MRISRIRLSLALSPQAVSGAPAGPVGRHTGSAAPVSPFGKASVSIGRASPTGRGAAGLLQAAQPLCLSVLRRGPLGQAVLLLSDEAHTRSGPLAPRELPRFFATMSRSDARCETPRRYAFRRDADPAVLPGLSAGPPRFLDRSVRARRPQSPRRARRLLVPVASSPTQASPHPEGWPLSTGVTRPNRVRFRYGSRVCLARLRTSRIAPARARVATCVTGRSHGNHLSGRKIGQACPGAPDGHG